MAVIDASSCEIASMSVEMEAPICLDNRSCQDANIWWRAVSECLKKQAARLRDSGYLMKEIEALAVDGTSGTMLLAGENLLPLTLGYMYDSAGFYEEAETIANCAPENFIARGANSALARLLFLQKQIDQGAAKYILYQADWIAACLTKRGGFSDETNVLKMGLMWKIGSGRIGSLHAASKRNYCLMSNPLAICFRWSARK